VIGQLQAPDSQLDSALGRVSPIVKLGVAVAWLAGMALTMDPRPPLILAVAAFAAATILGDVPPARYFRHAAPLLIAAVSIGVFNALFSGANDDFGVRVALQIGPIRIVEPALLSGVGLFARVLAMAATAIAFSETTDSTRLVDSLVRQGRVPARFGYGALAAYQSIPRLVEDLGSLRASRRIRGMWLVWHPRILLGLLVRAIRHGDALALAMDARAFGAAEQTWYRELSWTRADVAVGAAGAGLLLVALQFAG
jgi:energy-coupling factor transport system permease protein